MISTLMNHLYRAHQLQLLKICLFNNHTSATNRVLIRIKILMKTVLNQWVILGLIFKIFLILSIICIINIAANKY